MKIIKLTDYEAYSVLSMIDAIQKCPLKTMKALNKVYRKICEAEEEEWAKRKPNNCSPH